LPLSRLGLHRRSRVRRIGNVEKLVEKREGVIELAIEPEGSPGDLVTDRVVAVVLLDAEVVAKRLAHGEERNRPSVRHALARDDEHAAGSEPLDELMAEAALADSGVGDDADHLSLAR